MQVNPAARWTVLIYTSASKDLEQAVEDSLQEITDHPLQGDQVHIVAQRGRDSQAQRFQLHGSEQPLPLGPAQAADMTSSQTLQQFLEWGMEAYPAERYVVVLGGHAAGFAGAVTNSQRSKMLSLPDIEKALGELPTRPEILVFNTCLMAQAEAAEQFSENASYLVASQSQLKGLGLPLAPWFHDLATASTSQEAASRLVEHSQSVPERSPAVSAIDLQVWPELRERIDALALEIPRFPQHRQRLLEHIQSQSHLWPRESDRPLVDQIDVGVLSSHLSQDETLPKGLRQAAQSVVEGLPSLMLGNSSSSREEAGLSIYAPDQPFENLGPPQRNVGQIYRELRWSEATHWDEAIRWLSS